MKKKAKMIVGIVVGVLAVGLVATSVGVGVSVAQKRAKCEHVWDDGTVTKVATCKEAGEMTFECDKCGKKEKETIEALAHTWKEVEALAPTCTKDGHTEYIICTSCSEYKNGVKPLTLPMLGHIEVVVKGYANTCTEPGLSDGTHCTRCDEDVVEQVVIPAPNHKLVTINPIAPTCTESGWTAGQKCEVCEFVYTQPDEIPATGEHHFEDGECTMCELSHASVLFEEYAEADATSFQTVKAGDTLSAGTVYKVDRSEYFKTAGTYEKVYMNTSFVGAVDNAKYKAGLHIGINSGNKTEAHIQLYFYAGSIGEGDDGFRPVASLALEYMELEDGSLLIYIPSNSYKLTYNNTVYEFTLKFTENDYLSSFQKAI